MNFAVIGEPCVDYIHYPDKKSKKSPGGILYSVVSLAVIAGAEHTVYPIMYLGSDEFENISSLLSGFRNIKKDFVFKTEHKTRVVDLYYGGLEREETSSLPAPPLEFQKIKKALPAIHALLINMISGTDITLDTMKKIRSSFDGYIHMDMHNLTMRTEADGRRVRQPAENWEQWCTNRDTVQMNETELMIMTGKTNEDEAIEQVLSTGTTSVIITRGENGAAIFCRDAIHRVSRFDEPTNKITGIIDSTGCGDVFASAFFFKRGTGGGLVEALKFANKIAGIKTEFSGIDGLSVYLKETKI